MNPFLMNSLLTYKCITFKRFWFLVRSTMREFSFKETLNLRSRLELKKGRTKVEEISSQIL